MNEHQKTTEQIPNIKVEHSRPFLMPWKLQIKSCFVLFIILVFLPTIAFIDNCGAAIPDTVLKQQNAVVMIEITDHSGKKVSVGSGFILASDGIVVTNYHVIADWLNRKRKGAIAKLENGTFTILEGVIAIDKNNDIAILKSRARQLPVVHINRQAKLKKGEDVYVIGSPLGLELTLSQGILSNVQEDAELIQITSPISPGNSGSPVFNSRGEVIGVATFLLKTGQNLNFAIPISKVLKLLDSTNAGVALYKPSQDVDITIRSGSFAVYKDGPVLDEKTSLMWAPKDNGSPINWEMAKAYCESYRGGGYSDWRMPTQDELIELYGKGKIKNIYRNVISISGSWVWTSETNEADANIFIFDHGKRNLISKADSNGRALPVRNVR